MTYLQCMVNGDLRENVKMAASAAGGVAALARALGVTSQAVSQWRKIPAERVPAVSRATDLPPHLLRPDLYRRPLSTGPDAEAQAAVEHRR